MKQEMVRLEAGVNLMSIGQLKEAFLRQREHDSVLEWLREMVEQTPLLLTSDSGLKCRKAK